MNCLTNKAKYIDSWKNDSSDYIGQAIPVDEQCKLFFGESYKFDVSLFKNSKL